MVAHNGEINTVKGNYTWTFGELSFAGIALGTAATLIIFHHDLQCTSSRLLPDGSPWPPDAGGG